MLPTKPMVSFCATYCRGAVASTGAFPNEHPLYLGAVGGALIGSGITVGVGGTTTAVSGTLGAVFGTVITHAIVAPQREGARQPPTGRIAVRFTPSNALLAAAAARVPVSLLQVSF